MIESRQPYKGWLFVNAITETNPNILTIYIVHPATNFWLDFGEDMIQTQPEPWIKNPYEPASRLETVPSAEWSKSLNGTSSFEAMDRVSWERRHKEV